MCLLFLTGTIFPQGEKIDDYIKAGGKYITVVRALDLLDVFMSPLFICAVFILLLNLAVCLYDRMKMFLRIKRKPLGFEDLKNHANVLILETTIPRGDVESRLKAAGFRFQTESSGVKIFEKGLQYWWLSWFYHVGIILAIFGFFLTALFSFENYVTLYPDKPETISLYSSETRWNQFISRLGMKTREEGPGDKYTLTLKEFGTEYYQGLKIDYPKEKMEKFRLGVGLKRLEPSTKGFSYMPKMWLTRLDVQAPDGHIADARLWVNRPFRSGALTLYQMGYEQKLKLVVNGDEIEAEARVPFEIKGVKGKFVFESLKVGTLFRKDGSTEKITPVTTVYYMPEDKPSEKESLGELKLGGKLEAKGAVLEFKDYVEGSTLSYRKDPGVGLVGFACWFIFLGLIARSLGAWYRIQCAVEGNTAYVLISTRGILADKDRIVKKVME